MLLSDSSKEGSTRRLHPSLDPDQRLLIRAHRWRCSERANLGASVGVTQRRCESLLYRQTCVFRRRAQLKSAFFFFWCCFIAVSQGYISAGPPVALTSDPPMRSLRPWLFV